MKINKSGEMISGALTDWLKAEVTTSSTGQNKVLDDWPTAVRGLRGGWDHPQNFTTKKIEGHMDRLDQRMEVYQLDPANDLLSARLLYSPLAQMSGSYRNQCYVEAVSQDDYTARRQKATGVNVEQIVAQHLRGVLPRSGNFSKAETDEAALLASKERAQEQGLARVRAMVNRTHRKYDLGIPGSFSAIKMAEAQYEWLTFAVDCVVMAAKIRQGDLEAVPFLEPIDVSHQSRNTYPAISPSFAGWGKILNLAA